MSVAVVDMKDDLHWSESDKGLVLVSCFWLDYFIAVMCIMSDSITVVFLLGLCVGSNSWLSVGGSVWCKMDIRSQVSSISF